MRESPPAGFVFAEPVREQMGVSLPTFYRRIKERGLILYGHPRDRRSKLLRDEDAQNLLSPQPSKRREKAGAAS